MKGLKKWFTNFGTWIGGVLLAAVFLPKDIGQLFMLAFTVVWLIARLSTPLARFLKRSWARIKQLLVTAQKSVVEKENDDFVSLQKCVQGLSDQVQMLQKQNRKRDMTAAEMPDIIDRQLCAKITDKLWELYPDASWSWMGNQKPSELAAHCLTGRIKTAQTGTYNQAEVSFLGNGSIKITMMVVTELEELKSATVSPEEEPLKEWYAKALKSLSICIDDLFSRGIKTLCIDRKGDMMTEKDQEYHGTLKNMPDMKEWPQLIELMKADDIQAACKADKLVLSWGANI